MLNRSRYKQTGKKTLQKNISSPSTSEHAVFLYMCSLPSPQPPLIQPAGLQASPAPWQPLQLGTFHIWVGPAQRQGSPAPVAYKVREVHELVAKPSLFLLWSGKAACRVIMQSDYCLQGTRRSDASSGTALLGHSKGAEPAVLCSLERHLGTPLWRVLPRWARDRKDIPICCQAAQGLFFCCAGAGWLRREYLCGVGAPSPCPAPCCHQHPLACTHQGLAAAVLARCLWWLPVTQAILGSCRTVTTTKKKKLLPKH